MHKHTVIASIVLLAAFCSLSSVAAAALQVGVGRTEITPQEPMPLWGYTSRTDPFQHTYDPLYCRAVVFYDGTTSAAIITLDLGRTPPGDWVQRIRTHARQKYSIAQVLLTATHTHAAPNLGPEYHPSPWLEEVAGKIDEAIKRARATLQPAVLKTGQGAVDITYDRRLMEADGSVTMLWQNHERRFTQPVDQRIKVLQIDSVTGQPIATLVHYACHPVISGSRNQGVTAEIPGVVCSYVREHVGGECLFVQGACGDINPYQAGALQQHHDAYPFFVAEAERVGQEVLRIVAHAQPDTSPDYTIRYQDASIRFGLRHPVSDERLANMLQGRVRAAEMKAAADPNYYLEAPVSILTLGSSFAWAGFPGEFFDDFQVDLADRSPIGQTYFVGFCNGYYSYFPTIQAAAEGGYGASWGLLAAAGTGERFVDQAIIMLYQLLGKL